jgi:cephalosporin hydroxylase
MTDFIVLSSLYEGNVIFNKCYWIWLRAIKNPLDAWIYQELIYRMKPDAIVEIGSADGGSTLF